MRMTDRPIYIEEDDDNSLDEGTPASSKTKKRSRNMSAHPGDETAGCRTRSKRSTHHSTSSRNSASVDYTQEQSLTTRILQGWREEEEEYGELIRKLKEGEMKRRRQWDEDIELTEKARSKRSRLHDEAEPLAAILGADL